MIDQLESREFNDLLDKLAVLIGLLPDTSHDDPAKRSSLERLNELNIKLAQDKTDLRSTLQSSGGGKDAGGLRSCRIDQLEKQAQRADDRMTRVEASLGQIQVTLAGLSTKDSVRNVGLALGATIVATVLAAAALLLGSSANQLAAFQSGLAAIQTNSSAKEMLGSVAPAVPKATAGPSFHAGANQLPNALSPTNAAPVAQSR